MRSSSVAGHKCGSNSCSESDRCLFKERYDIVITAVDLFTITVCVPNNTGVENVLDGLHKYWHTVQLYPRKRFIFSPMSHQQLVSLLREKIGHFKIFGIMEVKE